MLLRNRWVILSIGMTAQVASVGAMFGVPIVLPQLRQAFGVTTAQAGLLSGIPAFGLLLTLLLWGLVIDRVGERVTMALSLLLTAGALGVLWIVTGLWTAGAVLLLVGTVAGPVNAASGRLVLVWFAPHERGLAMGIRQSAFPLGVGLASLVLPTAADAWGFAGAMSLPAGLALLVTPLILAIPSAPSAPVRTGRTEGGETRRIAADSGSPYRRWTIWRVHGASMLLGVAQITMMTYALIYLVEEQGWDPPAAGAVVALAQIPGAGGRLLFGVWSDRMGDRMRPVRWLAAVATCCLLLLSALPAVWAWTAVPLVLACLSLTSWHNGLTFTSVAEIAGASWAGRALAVQNWLQGVSTTLTPVLMAAVITLAGLPAVFAASAMFSAAAIAVVPLTRRGLTTGEGRGR